MENITYFTIWHDEKRSTSGHSYNLHDTNSFKIGDAISLDEPGAKGEYVITHVGSKQAIGGGSFPHFELKAK